MTTQDNYTVRCRGDANGDVAESVQLLAYTPKKNGNLHETGNSSK